MRVPDGPRHLLQSLVTIAVLGYGGLLLGLWLLQDRMIFFPQPIPPGTREWIGKQVPTATEITVAAADGTRLHGWLRRAAAAPAGLVVYFGGNAEEVSWLVADGPWPADWSVAMLNYRGYGASEGRPSERTLFADALAIHDRLVADTGCTRVVAFGRSLGSGVAVHLASQRALAGVVLVSPYDSVRAVASDVYPWVPVKWLLRHPFDSIALAPRIDVPLLALIAAGDRVIPPAHSRRLVEAWGGPARTVEIDRADHNDVAERPAYAAAIRAFLAELAARRADGC